MVTFEHILWLPNVNDCCKELDNLISEEPETPQEGLTMVRCRVCKSRHFNQTAEGMVFQTIPTV